MKRQSLKLVLCVFCISAQIAIAGTLQIVDKNGDPLEAAVVIVHDNADAMPINKEGYQIDQVNRQFAPQILAIPINSAVSFPNSDDVRHHVYSFSDAKTFELRLYHANEADPVLFDKGGIVTIGCNIHDSMRAYIYVTDQSLFGQSDANGNYELPDSDSGRIEVWYPPMEAAITVNPELIAEQEPVALPVLPIDKSSSEQNTSLEERLKRFKRDAQ